MRSSTIFFLRLRPTFNRTEKSPRRQYSNETFITQRGPELFSCRFGGRILPVRSTVSGPELLLTTSCLAEPTVLLPYSGEVLGHKADRAQWRKSKQPPTRASQ